MSDKKFTEEEVAMLSNNIYVQHVNTNVITYTDEFKRIFIDKNESGMLPRDIFQECGFDIDILGMKRVRAAGNRWRTTCRKNGVLGLRDTRKDKSGRPSEKNLSLEEKYERLKAQNNLLKAENELLKKIDMLERGMRKKK